MLLPHAFATFYERICLGDTQIGRIKSAAARLQGHLCEGFGLPEDEVFLQGSIPNGTAVKPAPDSSGGEYDVDLVAVCITGEESPEAALDLLEQVLGTDEDLKGRIDPKRGRRPCVRLRYADEKIGGFHVDVTPMRRARQAGSPLELPRPGEGWRPSAPHEYTQWCRDQGPAFARTVQMLKRWRDVNQDARESVKSVVLQVLISRALPRAGSDDERVAGTLEGIRAMLADSASPPRIAHPALPQVDICERWKQTDYEDFRTVVSEAASTAQHGLVAADEDRSHQLWKTLFGQDFPPAPRKDSTTPPPRPRPGQKRVQRQSAPHVEWG